jgi:hypothetical protein
MKSTTAVQQGISEEKEKMNHALCVTSVWRRPLFAFGLLLGLATANILVVAYPPAPFHLFYGMLRDEYGTPIHLPEAEVFLETASGVKIKTTVNPGIEKAANYWLEVPMDAGLIAAAYKPTALRPTVPFRIKVRIGGVTYLPIEMAGDFASLGEPGKRTRLNLTLGEDKDGDGLPDAWERLVNPDVSKVLPGAEAGNGLNYLETYYAGTYAVDPANGFFLQIIGSNNGAPLLEFLAVTGRTYTLQGSRDLKTWETVLFRIPSEGSNAPIRESFLAGSIKPVRIEVANQGANPPSAYFRLMLQ